MKKIITLFLISLGQIVFAQHTKLTVDIIGLSNDNGTVKVGLFNAKENFLKTIYKGASSKIKQKSASVIFLNIPYGEYAVSVYHDQNNNSKLDLNFMGIPKEDFACSNNAKGLLGPPKYDEAKFKLTKDLNVEIDFKK